MVLPELEYLAPETIEEACSKYAALEDAFVMAGATDVIPPMKDKAITPKYLIDLKCIPGLDYIKYDDENGLRIGALTTLRTIEKSDLVKEKYPAVAQAAKYIASTQVRAKGTMAGNICNASPSCDSGPILLVLGAKIHTISTEGERVIPIEDFFVGVKKTSLQKDKGEILTEIQIPPVKDNEHSAYIKHAVRKAMDLAIVGVAAKVTVKDGVCTDAKLAAGAVATTPIRLPEAEELLVGKALTDDVLTECSEKAMELVHPISDIRASDIYRKDMVRVFTKRAVIRALES